MARAHSAAAAIFVSGVVLVPLGLWLYAHAASADKGAQVAHAERLLTDVAPPLPGARRLGLNVYEHRKWEGEGLVPIADYLVETAYRLPRPVRAERVVEHYRRRLPGWRMSRDPPIGTTFARGNDTIEIDIFEYRENGRTLRSYGVLVSQ